MEIVWRVLVYATVLGAMFVTMAVTEHMPILGNTWVHPLLLMPLGSAALALARHWTGWPARPSDAGPRGDL